MSTLNLSLHCGGYRATLDRVAGVATPNAEGGWRPIPHIEVHQGIERALGHLGLTIVNQVHALSSHDARYFALYHVQASLNPTIGLVIGTRNSHDKKFVAGIAAGEGVFVCDNLAFWSEVVLGRKHTTHIMRDLPVLVDRAVGQLTQKWASAESRVEKYQSHLLSDERAHDLMIRSIDSGVITPSALPRIIGEWRRPRHPEFAERGPTAWRLFNSYTQELKVHCENPETLMKRSQILHGMMSAEVGLTRN